MPSYSAVRAGDRAPMFTLPDDTGTPVSLARLKGRRVVLYFYPKDATTGCTIEACEFRDLLPRFEAADAVVLGISPDSVRSHAKFKAAQGLTFPLLADTEHEVVEKYGVWREKMLYGRKYMGVMRTTYVISATGRVERVWEHVKHEGHAAEVEAYLRGEEPTAQAVGGGGRGRSVTGSRRKPAARKK